MEILGGSTDHLGSSGFFHSPVGGSQGVVLEKKNKHKNLSSLSVARGDTSPGAPPRLGELWVTDPTPDSLRLSWTVPEGHFDSFVVQFKDRDGPRVVPAEGHERSVTIGPLDASRKYTDSCPCAQDTDTPTHPERHRKSHPGHHCLCASPA